MNSRNNYWPLSKIDTVLHIIHKNVRARRYNGHKTPIFHFPQRDDETVAS